ncbi:MAG: hypothetical protein KGJ86_14005, partial [Chloroflexota bacterium]|nr:hypothetical protein [Chloroflexota bacterium]
MEEFVVLSPVGAPAKLDRRQLRTLSTPEGKRVAFLWGMHGNSLKFWPVFEQQVEERYKPSETYRHYKKEANGQFMGNTWIPAPVEVIK